MDKKTIIQPLSPILKQQILSWDMYKDKRIVGYDNILKYVRLEDFDYYFKYIHYDGGHSSGRKDHFSFVLQEDGDVKSFVECFTSDEKTDAPNLHMTALFSHPLHQHEGYGTELVKGILKNPQKFIGLKPTFISGMVEKDNFACHKFFQQFGKTHVKEMFVDYNKVTTRIDYDALEKL